jgi:protein-S-isoprenylcysteine O-methyltransferase Ste14
VRGRRFARMPARPHPRCSSSATVRHLSSPPSPPGIGETPARLVPYTVFALAAVTGVASLAFFVLFLLGWYVAPIRSPPARALLWDAALSLAFFVQHSGMVRRPLRARMAAFVPRQYDGAAYGIASGLVLGAVLLLWRRSEGYLLVLHGPWRWAARACALAAMAVFARSVIALRSFDPFGLLAIGAHLRGRRGRHPATFAVAGPYRWVRHPLYSCMLVLMWSCPTVTADRLLLDVLWTAWICFGAALEERDLVDEFGDAYLRYRERVPMLVPWRGRVAMHLEDRTRPERR